MREHLEQLVLPLSAGGLAVVLLVWWLGGTGGADLQPRLPNQDGVPPDAGRSMSLATPPVAAGEPRPGEGKPSSLAGQWTGFRGNDRDGIAHDAVPLARTWPSDVPPVLWTVTLGEGYAGAAIAGGCVYVLDYDEGASADTLRCLSLDDGREVWRNSYPVQLTRNHGMSRTVPAVVGDNVITMGPRCHGAEAFAALGTEKSKGTKVFALAGRIVRGGLIEVPMGVTIGQIVQDIGGGVTRPGRFKAVQVGGPSGGCSPAELADTPVDYEALAELGAIMGSGGMVVLDDSDCMVDIARYFLRFTQDQSCGKCTFCRVGTKRMLDIMDRICTGDGRRGDLQKLEELSAMVCAGSLCGLGKTAPNPVLTTLKYFRDEYEARPAFARHAQAVTPIATSRSSAPARVAGFDK